MSLDLGSLVGEVRLDATLFETTYVRVVRQMAELGARAGAAATGTSKLDRSLAEAGASASTAAAGLGRADKALAGAGVSASEAAAATRRLSMSTAQSARATTDSSLASSRLTQAQLRQAAATARVAELQTTGTATTRQLAAAQASLIAANDRVAVSEERVRNTTLSTWGSIGSAVKSGATVVAVAAAATGFEALKMAGDFQTAATRIHTQADATVKQTQDLSAGFLKMAAAVAESPTALATAGFHIASVGQKSMTTAQELQVLKMAAEGAKLGGADLVDVTNALDAAVVSGIHGVTNYSQAMGVLNATVGAGDMTMQNLAEAFGPLGAILKGYNVTIQQAGAALATFGDNNIRGAEAGTALRMAVQALAVPVAAGKKQLEAWGLSSGNLTKQLQQGGLTEALDVLMQKMRANGVTAKAQGTVLTEAFGKRAGVGIAVLMGELDRYHNKLDEVSKGGNTFASSWTGYTKTFSYNVDSAKAAAESLAIQLGQKLLPTATSAMHWLATSGVRDVTALGHAIQSAGQFVERNATAFKVLAGVVAASASAFVVYKAAVTGIALVEGAMAAGATAWAVASGLATLATGDFAAAVAALDIAIQADPIVLIVEAIIAAVALLGFGIYELVKHFDTVKEVLVKFGPAVLAAFMPVIGLPLLLIQHWRAVEAAFATLPGRAVRALRALPSELGAVLRHAGTAMVQGTEWGIAAVIAATVVLPVRMVRALASLSTKLPSVARRGWSAFERASMSAATSVVSLMASLPGRFVAGLRALPGMLDHSGGVALHGMLIGAEAGAKALLGFAAHLPAEIVHAVGDLSHILFDAGRAAINGLINGFESMIGGIKDKLHSITKLIPLHKGPPSADLRLLYGSGQLIVQGLIDGISSKTQVLIASLRAMTAMAAQATAQVVSPATQKVYATIAAAVAPQASDPSQLGSILATDTGAASSRQASADAAQASYAALATRAAVLAAQLKQVKADTLAHARALAQEAAEAHAAAAAIQTTSRSMSDQAHAAMRAAEAMPVHTKAQRAAKAAAEQVARALADEARTYGENAKAAKAAAEAHARALSLQAKAAALAASSSGAAVKAAQRAADAAAAAASKAKDSFDALSQAAKDAAQTAADAAQQLVQSLTDATSQMAQQVQQFQQQISSGITGSASLSSIWQQLSGTDANGNPLTPTLTGVQTTFDSILASAQQFAADLSKVAAEGGDQNFVTQLDEMGIQAGDALAQQLLAAGPEAIKALQTSMEAIQAVADAEGNQLSQVFYGQGVDALAQLISGMESQFPELQAALQAVLDTVTTMFGPAAAAAAATAGAAASDYAAAASSAGQATTQPVPLPHFASGVRNFAGGLALVGELGPEVVSLPAGASVYPHGSDGASLLDMSAVVDRLERIEARLADAPAATGAAVGAATVDGFRHAGREQAAMNRRLDRKR